MNAVRQKTVLCVDDEAIGLRVRKIMLEPHGFQVLTASDGQQGIDLFDQHDIDLVVLDFYMPGLNGGEVAADCTVAADVPSSFLSAYFSLPSDALEMADAFITKGEPPEVLIEKIEQADVIRWRLPDSSLQSGAGLDLKPALGRLRRDFIGFLL